MVHLSEISGPKTMGHTEFRQVIGQCRCLRWMEQGNAVQATRLQIENQTFPVGKVAQERFVICAQGLQYAQHHSVLQFPGSLFTNRQFDLWQAFRNGQAGNQRAQLRQQGRNSGWQNFTAIHVRHVAAATFMKTNQHPAFLAHQTHGQTRPVAITPGWPLYNREHDFRPQLGDVPQVVFQHTLLDGSLCHGIKMLHAAAPANTEMRTARCDTQGAGPQDAGRCGFFKIGFAAKTQIFNLLTRQGRFDENGLAINMGHALPFMIQ